MIIEFLIITNNLIIEQMTEYKIMLKKTLPSKYYPKNYKDAMILLKATVSAYLERKIEKKTNYFQISTLFKESFFCLTGF
jgi:hypothetical protein